jgi:mono/diheme cytochrome c family protein
VGHFPSAIFPAGVLFLAAMSSAIASGPSGAVARGHYLSRAGDCRACHTQPGHAPFSGGVPIETPFGVIYTPNITPDDDTGIGNWTFKEFYRALHSGLAKNGDYLYPAFPFPAFTLIKRKDVKAIWAYLETVKPAHRKNRPDTLSWPYSIRSLMGLWRHLYFDPGVFKADPKASEAVNRGAYLVKGLAHCGACHTPRSRLGATKPKLALAGGTVPVEGWYAPNITSNPYIGIGDWSKKELVSFLGTGRSARGAAVGPMRDVVQSSLQHLSDADIEAIAAFLKNSADVGPGTRPRIAHRKRQRGEKKPPGETLYGKYCSDCHGDRGRAKHAYYPDLRGNSIVLARNPANLLLIMLRGGFEAATRAHPYPFSMPPFEFKLRDGQIADIANYVRRNWTGRVVPPVQASQVAALR